MNFDPNDVEKIEQQQEEITQEQEMEIVDEQEESQGEGQHSDDLDPQEVEEAKAHGYLTKDQYIEKHGSLKGFKDPKAFNQYAKEYDELSKLRKTIEKRDKELEATLSYINNVKERERAKAKQELSDALRQAKNIGDVESVEKLTEQKYQFDQEEKQTQHDQTKNEMQSAAQYFTERNKHWFNPENAGLQQKAVSIEEQIKQGTYRLPSGKPMGIPLTWHQLMDMVEYAMSEEHPEITTMNDIQAKPIFQPSRSAANRGATGSATGKHGLKDLDDQQRLIYEAGQRLAKNSGLKGESVDAFLKRWNDNYED